MREAGIHKPRDYGLFLFGKLFVAFIFLNFPFSGFAGKVNVEWLADSLNLGRIPEEGGKVAARYSFVNKGKKAVKIDKVILSCGCTEADYTQEKINRGDTSSITLIYDPEDRVGNFKRSTFVYFEKQSVPYKLLLCGDVIPSRETLSLLYPFSAGTLYFDQKNIDFGEISRGVRRRKILEIYNGGDKPVKPVCTSDSNSLSWALSSSEITPGGKALLTIYLDTSKEIGFGWREITIRCEGGDGKDIIIKVSFDVKAT